MEKTDRMNIKNARNGQEYRLNVLRHYIVNVYCPDTNVVYEFCGCFWHRHHTQPFGDVNTVNEDTLAAGDEHAMSRLIRKRVLDTSRNSVGMRI